jgi:hypothetical protein
MQATCTVRAPAPLAPYVPWVAAVLAALALAGALAAALAVPGTRDLAPRHAVIALRPTAL